VIIVFQFHLRTINDLVFLSILDLLLLNNLLKNENQAFLKKILFLDFQINFSTNFKNNSKCIVQKNSTNGYQSHLKLQANIKRTFFPTSNANIFQSVRSNLVKFLSHDLRQVKYKIRGLDSQKIYFSFFLDERNKTSSFECFLTEKWRWAFRGTIGKFHIFHMLCLPSCHPTCIKSLSCHLSIFTKNGLYSHLTY